MIYGCVNRQNGIITQFYRVAGSYQVRPCAP